MKNIFKTKKYFSNSKFFGKNFCKGYKNFATKIKFSKTNSKWAYGGAAIFFCANFISYSFAESPTIESNNPKSEKKMSSELLGYLFDTLQKNTIIQSELLQKNKDDIMTQLEKQFDPESILRNLIFFPKTSSLKDDLQNPNALEIEYTATFDQKDIEFLLSKIKNSNLIHKYHISDFLQLIVPILFSKDFEPSPRIFDSLVIQYYSVPIVIFRNTSTKDSKQTYSMFLEITKLREEMILVTKRTANVLTQDHKMLSEKHANVWDTNNFGTKVGIVTASASALIAVGSFAYVIINQFKK